MDSHTNPNMQSYPSPTAVAADSGGPFYSTPSNQQAGVLTHSDELADLQRDLAPIMHAGQGGGLQDVHDPRNHGAMNDHYENDSHPAAHLQAGHAMNQMAGQYAAHDGHDAAMPPRKRSKTSRACDECRRKKIRCDATGGDEGKDQCANCKRVGARCQFSRVPLKRGPSKGYIKDLAARVDTLEGVMHVNEAPLQQQQYVQHQDNSLQQHGSDDFSPSPNTEMSPRKRAYSSISGEFNSPYQQPRAQSREWPSQEQPRHLPHPASTFESPQSGPAAQNMFREPNYSPNGLPPNPQWRKAPETTHRQGGSLDGIAQAEHGHADNLVEWNEQLIDVYYKAIHPTYPLLSHSKGRMNARLATCSPALKNAFFEALYAAAQSFAALGVPSAERRGTKKAHHILALQTEANGSMSTSLVYLQTMLLMAIEADNRGPVSNGQTSLPSSVWLGSAVGLAYSLKLHVHKSVDPQSEGDPDSEDKLARRLWWCLVIMDRWHAASTSSPVLIPDGCVIVYPEDQALLGDVLYHLARLSIVLGHFSAVQIAPTDAPGVSVPPASLLAMLLRGELERCRETFPQNFFPPSNAPIIHLCYWYLRILVELRLSPSEPEDILGPAMHIVTQLTHNTSLMSPLTHHATAIAASTLIELTSYDKTKDSAGGSLISLLENRIAPSAWDAAIRDMIVNKLNQAPPVGAGPAESQHALTASQGLQRLADLATATEGDRADATTIEGRKEAEKANPSPVGNHSLEPLQGLKDLVSKGYMGGLGA